jgi:hypothetical protein
MAHASGKEFLEATMTNYPAATIEDGRATTHKLDEFVWSFFFIWIGIALLANLGWGIGLLGVGILILGKQATRKYMALRLEMFGVVVGVLFVLCGIWELLSIRVSLIPIVFIAAGVALLASALFGKPKD